MELLTKKEFKTVRAKLLMEDITFAQIARDFYCSREFVGQAARGQHKSQKANDVRAFINKEIGGGYPSTSSTNDNN